MTLPSGVRYWTVLDQNLAVVAEADAFLRHVRFGRDRSELTTRAYAGGVALFLRWCARTGRHWHAGVEQRVRAARARHPLLDEPRWRATEPAVGRGGEVSLRGLPPLVVAELLFGLQQRCRINAVKTGEAVLRALCCRPSRNSPA